MSQESIVEVDEKNRWRLETPGHEGWKRTARPGDPDKYLMISADCHANEPGSLWRERLDAKYRDRLPHVERRRQRREVVRRRGAGQIARACADDRRRAA